MESLDGPIYLLQFNNAFLGFEFIRFSFDLSFYVTSDVTHYPYMTSSI